MSSNMNGEQVSRDEMIQTLFFHFISKNYSDDYLEKLSNEQLQAEYENYINNDGY